MAALDITHRQYSRLFERATTAINRKLVAYLAGDWCPGHASRFARLAASRATPRGPTSPTAPRRVPGCRGAYETFTRLHPAPEPALTSRRCDATGRVRTPRCSCIRKKQR